MSRLAAALHTIKDYAYGTFNIRRLSLITLAALSVALGPFLRIVIRLPSWAFLDVVYLYGAMISITFFFMYGAFYNTFKTLAGSIYYGLRRKHKPTEFTVEEYSAYGVTQILNEMGVKKRVRIFWTSNPWIEGPFTNAFTNNVFIPLQWRIDNPIRDLRGVIGHELAHVKTK